MSITSTEPAAAPERLTWWLRALARLPFPLLYALMAPIAWLLRYVLRYRVAVARDNLKRCFPQLSAREIRQLLAQHYRHLGQIAAEFFKLPGLSAQQICDRVRFRDFEVVQSELRAGRSVILISAHQCNWEWSLQAVALRSGVPMPAGYKPLHSEAADRQLRLIRTRFGAQLISAKRLLREILRHRRETRVLALMADQVPASSAGRIWVNFLGRETAFYPGPGEIARATGFAAVFVGMRRLRRGYYEMIFEPLCAAGEQADAATFTARYAAYVEAQVHQRPADWAWTHRRWKLGRSEEPMIPTPTVSIPPIEP